MRDGSQMEELTGAVGLGLLSGDVVLALGHLIHGASISEEETETLKHAVALLENLSGPFDVAGPSSGLRQLATGETALDVLTAVETEAAEADLADFLEPLAAGLRDALAGQVTEHVRELEILRRVFASIGDAEVERVSRLSRPRAPSMPLWLS